MTRTKVALEFFLPTGSFSRINDAIEETRAVLEKHKGTDFFITYSGPFPDDTEAKTDGRRDADRDLGRSGSRDQAGAEARPEPAEPADPSEPVKRGRGRPRKSDDGAAEASGPSAGQRGGKRAEGPGEPAEGDRRHERDGTDEGAGKGRGEGEGRTRGTGRDRGTEQRDPEPARVKPAADEWDDPAPAVDNDEEGEDWWAKTPGDEWPDHLMPEGTLDKASLGEVLSQHYEQTGDRAKTLAVLKEATGESGLVNVHPDDYDKAARALLKDAARIRHGVKR